MLLIAHVDAKQMLWRCCYILLACSLQLWALPVCTPKCMCVQLYSDTMLHVYTSDTMLHVYR